MKFVPPEPTVDLYNEGFGESDILDRKKVGQSLSNLLDRIEDPVVVALDGKWGTGKSYFLKRWVGAHKNENGSKATTVYFDAFAHDYLSDPLPALVSSLAERLPKDQENKIQTIKKAAYKLIKPAARIGLAVATYSATEVLNNAGDAAVKAIRKETADSLEKYWAQEDAKRAAITEFKNAIEALAAPQNEEETGSSVVIVIDELDRCRPDYALEVLEVIKHFFSVPHLHFVLGVNLNALENSVRARYGEKIDAQAYLKKFIQITLELPSNIGNQHKQEQATHVYLEHLIEEMGIPEYISSTLLSQIKLASRANHISMRDIGKIVSSVTLVSSYISDNTYNSWVSIMIDLIITSIIHPEMYTKF